MRTRLYLDFDLLIEPDGLGGYRARVLRSPAGETAGVPFAVPFSDLELDNFYLRIGAARGGAARGERSAEAAAVTAFGEQLFDAVFQHDLREALVSSRNQAEGQDAGLRVRLRMTDSPELADLPWEYLFDRTERRFMALSEWTPVVRYLDVRGPIKPLPVTPPLRILVHIASPTDMPTLDVEAEWVRIRDALAGLERSGRVRVDRVQPGGTMPALQKQLRRATADDAGYHVFHFIGHGQFDTRSGGGVLAFERQSGRLHEVAGEEIGAMLHDHRTLRLAVLNACEGARGGLKDPYAGTAQGLLRQGIPAVVAMQFPISDTAAIDFAQSLYEAVADGYPLDAAVAEARKAIKNEPNPIEWGTPVLYLRAPDGRIFDIPEGAPLDASPSTHSLSPGPDTRPGSVASIDQDPDWPAALDAYFTRHWDAAVELLARALARHPNDPRVVKRLQDATVQRDLSTWYTQGAGAAAAGDWERAVDAYERVIEADPEYEEVAEQLTHARWQSQRSQMIQDLRRLSDSGKWEAVLAAARELTELDPSTTDPEGVVTQARQALEEQDLAERYARGLRELEADDWASALATFTGIERDRSDYRQTQALLERLREAPSAHTVGRSPRAGAAGGPDAERPQDLFVPDPQTLPVGQWVTSLAFSPDGTRLVTASRRRVRVWDLHNGEVLWDVKIGGWLEDVNAVSFGPDGTRLAAASDDGTARIWDARTGEEQLQVTHGGCAIEGVAFTPDGTRLATASIDGTDARIWDARTGDEQVVVTHEGGVDAITFNPDGTQLATGSDDGTVRIWDARTGEQQLQVTHGGSGYRWIHRVAFSPDGTQLATASDDGTARLWNARTGDEELVVTHGGSQIHDVAFSPEGSRLATASADSTARLWDARTGQQLTEVSHGRPVHAVAFSPDGTRLATGGLDKAARIWDTSPTPIR